MALLDMFARPVAPTAPATVQAPVQAPAGKAKLPPADYLLTPLGPNPKRPGTAAHACTALYQTRPTVAAYLEAAGPRGKDNLIHDIKRGFVEAAPRG